MRVTRRKALVLADAMLGPPMASFETFLRCFAWFPDIQPKAPPPPPLTHWIYGMPYHHSPTGKGWL